jgi:hypothetical protein
MPQTFVVPPEPPHNEGKTIAAWLMTVTSVVGAILFAFGLTLDVPVLLIAGPVVIVVGFLISFVLRQVGLGQKRRGADAR